MRRLPFSLAFAVLLAACSDVTGPGEPSPAPPSLKPQITREVVRTPLVDLQVPNECTGELITVNGTFISSMTTVQLDNGTLKTFVAQFAFARGVSDKGVPYVLINATASTQIDHGTSDASLLSVPFILRFIGRGPGNDYYMHSLVHIRKNPDGQTVSHIDQTDIGCK
jgi:hypothetical protein